MKYDSKIDLDEDYGDVTRIEVIDAKGRSYANNSVESFVWSLQDEGKTLKVFVLESEEAGEKTEIGMQEGWKEFLMDIKDRR